MSNVKSIIAVLFILLLSGCGYKEGVATASQKSYLYFSGDTDDIEVSIDDGSKFEVEEGQLNQYSIKPGKHLIVVYKNNRVILKREIFVSDGVAKEIEVK